MHASVALLLLQRQFVPHTRGCNKGNGRCVNSAIVPRMTSALEKEALYFLSFSFFFSKRLQSQSRGTRSRPVSRVFPARLSEASVHVTISFTLSYERPRGSPRDGSARVHGRRRLSNILQFVWGTSMLAGTPAVSGRRRLDATRSARCVVDSHATRRAARARALL